MSQTDKKFSTQFFPLFSKNKSSLKFLINMRWLAWCGVLFALSILYFFFSITDLFLYSWILWLIYGFSNLFLTWIQIKAKENLESKIILSTFFFDQVYLSALILLNGGKHNPFAILFISLASAAAMILSKRQLISVIVFSIACLIFIYWSPFIEVMNAHLQHQHGSYSFHLQGMFWATTLGVVMGSIWIYSLRKKNELTEDKARKAQQLLAHLERMESMGRLVATTAHRINTPLASLQIAVSELNDEENPLQVEEQKQYFKDIERAVSQITQTLAEITQADKKRFNDDKEFQLLDFLEIFSKNWARPRHCELILSFQEKNITVNSQIAEDLLTCLQVFLDNAWEASQEKNPAEEKIKIQLKASSNQEFFEIEVIDHGAGMQAKLLEKIGTPFFTTKAEGTGLGLYHCYQIAKTYRGNLKINSILNQGTKVRLIIPLEQLKK